MLFSVQSLAGFGAVTAHPLIAIFVFVVSFLAALWLMGIENVESREPPVLRSRIPFIGHLISLFRYHNNYFTILRCV